MNTRFRGAIFISTCLIACCPTGAHAAEYGQTLVIEWPDPFTPPQTRTRCVSEARGDWPWGGEWKTCSGWATDFKFMHVQIYSKAIGPDALGQVAKAAVESIARTCSSKAGLGAVVALAGTPSPELSARLAAAWTVAVAIFNTCLAEQAASLAATGVATSALKLAFEPRSHWTSWSNERVATPEPPKTTGGKEHPTGSFVYKSGAYRTPDGQTHIAR